MGILNRLFGSQIQAYAPDDDYWYTSRVAKSLTGLDVTPETALRISTVFRCVSAISQDIAAMPLIMYRRLPRGKERARNHPLYDVLHDQPNQWQSSFEWREMMMGHLLLRGNAYNLIEPGERGFADQLIPLNPARMKVEQLPNRNLRYTYTWETLRKETYTQDEIFHLRGPSSDGITGLSVVGLARESMGLALATEEFGARVFSQGANLSGVLQVKGTISDEAAKRLGRGFDDRHTGLGKAHGTAVLEEGTTWVQVGMSNEDAQYLGTRDHQIEDLARWFGVPLHRIGHTEKATSWGSGIEQFNLGYIAYTLIPWITRWEQGIQKDLVLRPETFFIEFLLDHLQRGDIRARYNAYRTAIVTGWMTPNEVRERENMNQAPGLDNFLVPQNMAMVDEQGEVHPLNKGADQGGMPSGTGAKSLDSRLLFFVEEAAGRVVRKENTAVQRAAVRYEDDAEGFRDWADEFWAEHVDFIVEALHLDQAAALAHVDGCKALSPEELELTTTERTSQLAALAFGEVEEYATT